MPSTNGHKILRFEDLVPETRTIDIGGVHFQGFVWNGRMPRGVKAQVRQIARWIGTQTDPAAGTLGPTDEEFNDGLTRMLCLMVPDMDPAQADLFETDEAMSILRYLDYLPPEREGGDISEAAGEDGESDEGPLEEKSPTSTTSTRRAGSARSTK